MRKKKWVITALDLLFLAVLFWVVRYWHSRTFGLYEDDLTIIPRAFSMSFSELMHYIFSYITTFQGQGRPLHHSFIFLFSWLGWQLAGLWGAYLVGYLIEVLNLVLFYTLIRRVTDRPLAVMAGLAYVLFSADTTQAYLTASLGIQSSITLLLLAFHAYLSKKTVVAYLLVFLILFGYETPYLVFLAAPLIKMEWKREVIKEFVLHMVILGFAMLFVYVLRLELIGKAGVLDLTPVKMLTVSINHMVFGPFTALRTYLTRPHNLIIYFNIEVGLAVSLSLIVLAFFLWRTVPSISVGMKGIWAGITRRKGELLPEELRSYGRLFVAGLVMLVMAYPLTFTVDAGVANGRATRVHTAAGMGAAILIGVAVMLVLMLFESWKMRRGGILLLATWLSFLVGYGFILQADYTLAWKLERQFWTELLPLIPDAGEGTAVLVTRDGSQFVYQIEANTWNLPRVLNQLYVFPEEVTAVPRVYRLDHDWEQSLAGEDGKLWVGYPSVIAPSSLYEEYPSSEVIFIEWDSAGHLIRRTTPLELGGREYPLKVPSRPVLPDLPHGLLYDLMIDQP